MDPLSEGVMTRLGFWVRRLRAVISPAVRLGLGFKERVKDGSASLERKRLVKISIGWVEGKVLGSYGEGGLNLCSDG